MKKYAKLIVIVVAMCMVVSFAACAGEPAAQPPADAGEEPAVEATEQANEPTEETSIDEPVSADKELLIAHLPKSIGGAWYTRMYAGFERFAEGKDNTSVVQIGASEGDAALQNAAIEDFITEAQGKQAAICMSFVSPEASEQVLKKAMDAGLIVIGNEGPNAENVHYDMEAFDNAAFGADIAEELATMMGGEGKYIIVVGKLSSSTHMQWADAVKAGIAAKYPNIELVQDPYIEGNYDQQHSYEKTMEIIKTYPDIKGFFCTSATDAAGIARAIDETEGLADSSSFITLGTPDLYVDYIKSGAVDLLTGWDPSMLGEAMCSLIQKILDGEEIKSGMDLGVFGFDSIILEGKVIKGNEWQKVDTTNVDEILARDYQ
jgi:simple sugar transport system substrate-binding protein